MVVEWRFSTLVTLWRTRPWFKRTVIGVGAGALFLLLLFLMTPTLLSTGPGKRYVLSFINDDIRGRVEADSLSLGWFTGVKIKGLSLKDPSGKTVVSHVDLDGSQISLWSTFWGGLNLGEVRVSGARGELVQDEKGTLNLLSAIESRKPPKQTNKPGPMSKLKVNLKVDDAALSYTAPGVERVEVRSLSLNWGIPNAANMGGDLSAEVVQGQTKGKVTGRIKAIRDLFDSNGKIQPEKAKLEGVTLDVASLPIAPIDRLARQRNRLVAVLGPVLTEAKVSIDGRTDDLSVKVMARSDNLDADGSLTLRQHRFELASGSHVRLTIVPAAWAALTASPGETPAAKLLKSFLIELKPRQLSGQLSDDNKLRWSTLTAALDLTVGTIELDAGGDIGTITITSEPGSLEFDGAAGSKLAAHLDFLAKRGNEQGRLKLDASLTHLLTDDGSLDTRAMNGQFTASASGWPTIVIDQLAGTGRLIATGAGDVVDATLTGNLKPDADGKSVTGQVTLALTRGNLLGTLAARIADNRLAIDQPQTLVWSLSRDLLPQLVRRFAPDMPQLASMAMSGEAAKLNVSVDSLSVPMEDLRVNRVSGKIRVEAASLAVTGIPEAKDLSLAGLSISLAFDGPAGTLTASAGADATISGQPGTRLQLKQTTLTGLTAPDGSLAIGKAGGTIDLLLSNIPPALIDAFSGRKGVAEAMVGAGATVALTGSLKPARTSDIPDADLLLTVTTASQITDVRLPVTVTDGVLRLKPGADLKHHAVVQISPKLLAALSPQDSTAPKLAEPATATLKLNDLDVALSGEGWKHAAFAATITVDKVVPAGDPRYAGVRLQNLIVNIPKSSLDHDIKLAFSSDLVHPQRNGKLGGDITVTDLLGDRPGYRGNVTAAGLPVALVQAFSGSDLPLTDIIGEVIDSATVTITPDPRDPQTLALTAKVQSPSLTADLNGTYRNGQLLTLSKGSIARLTLDAKGFEALKRWLAPADAAAINDIVLIKPTLLTLDIGKLALGFKVTRPPGGLGPVTSLDPAASALNLTISCKSASFQSTKRRETADVSNLTIAVSSSSLAKDLTLVAHADTSVQLPGTAALPGKFDSNTRILLPFTADGRFNTSDFTAETDTSARNLPVGVVDAVGGFGGKLVGSLGPTANVTAKGPYRPGRDTDLQFDLESPNAAGSFPARITAQRELQLRQDSTLIIKQLTQELAEQLGLLHPLFVGAVSSTKPIAVRLQQKTFSAALDPFSINGASADVAVDIGTLKMKQGTITNTLNALAPLIGGGKLNDTYTAGFNQLAIHIDKGIVTSNDLWLTSSDMITGRFVALGVRVEKYDLAKKEGDFRIAIPGVMLQQIKPIKNHIKPDYVYEIRVRGEPGKLKPDWGQLIGAITTMTAKTELLDKLGPKNPLAAAILGELIDVLPLAKQQGDVATRWSNRPTKLPEAEPTP